MDIAMKEVSNVAVLSLTGRLDLTSGATLKQEVKKLSERDVNSIHLNLAKVDFINSSGLGVLVSIMKEVRVAKGRLTLSDLASYVQEIFDITQLSHIFEIFETEQEAMTTFQHVAAE